MGEVEFNNKEDEYKVKIVDGGEYKEPGGGIRKPSQEEIDSYAIHRIVVMVIFGIVVVVLLVAVVILIATVDRCEQESKKLPWWKSGVIYNVYPRSFKDSAKKNDGVGDFKGITEKLDYIKKLGVKILYLSSVFKVDKAVDYGYSVINFKETNVDYGSLKDFKELVDAAHKKDLKVVIEFVPSDTSVEHEWFKESRNASSPKRDWYIWTDKVDNSTMFDWQWTKDSKTGHYYLRQWNSTEGKADLNWNNDAVKKEMESVLGFWLDHGVDGFRVVSVERLFQKPKTNSELDKIHMILNKWHNYTTKKNSDSILIGSSHPVDLTLYGSKERPELDIVVNFKLVPENNEDMKTFYTAEKFQKLIDDYIDMMMTSAEGKWPSWALTSWVHKRMGSNVEAKLAKSLNVLLLTLPGTPIVFYGDEIGMKDVGMSNKSPMQWSNGSHTGFSSVSPWTTVGDPSTNAKDDTDGILKKFKEAVKLRAENEQSFLGHNLANFTTHQEGDVLAYTFQSNNSFVVALNFGSDDQVVNLTKVGVKEGELKLFTSDKKPEKISMDKVKVPSFAVFVFNVTKNVL